EAHKDYHPSVGMCVFGTNVRSLAAADYRADLTSMVMGRREMQRELSEANGIGTSGHDSDPRSRVKHFRERFCNRFDNNPTPKKAAETGLGPICKAGTVSAIMENKDIDFMRTVLAPRTLAVNFENQTTTG